MDNQYPPNTQPNKPQYCLIQSKIIQTQQPISPKITQTQQPISPKITQTQQLISPKITRLYNIPIQQSSTTQHHNPVQLTPQFNQLYTTVHHDSTHILLTYS